jgi:hypothetical protein
VANFPDSKRTGELAELAVETLFTSWGWTVGKDRIDVGYDHFVEPDRRLFGGARFLVQTKGTASTGKGRLVVPIDKVRLRQYAVNRIPVFVVRSLGTGDLLWLHVQAWCQQNRGRLDGEGQARIVVPSLNTLADRDVFEKYLLGALLPERTSRSLATAAAERSRYLSSIDSRVSVDVQATAQGEAYFLSAHAGSGVQPIGEFKFQFASREDASSAISKFSEHVDFGVPTQFEVAALHVSGSPVFDELGLGSNRPAKVELDGRRTNAHALVQLIAGEAYRVGVPIISSPSEVFAGQKGVSIRPKQASLVDIEVRLQPEAEGVSGNFEITVNHAFVDGRPLCRVTELHEFGRWSEEVLRSNSILTVLNLGGGKRVSSRLPSSGMHELRSLIEWLSLLSKAQAIAEFFNSDFQFSSEEEVSNAEIESVQTAFQLLRGERLQSTITAVDFEPNEVPLISDESFFILTSPFDVRLGGRLIGTLHIKIGLERFVPIYSHGKLTRLEADQNSRSWIMAHEPGDQLENVIANLPQ